MRGPRPYATRPKPEFRAFSSSPPNAVSKSSSNALLFPSQGKQLAKDSVIGLAIFVLSRHRVERPMRRGWVWLFA